VLRGGLALLAVGALTVPDLVAVKGDVGRMNTVFKFYLQAWILLAIVTAVWLTQLAAHSRPWWRGLASWRTAWLAAVVLLAVGCLIYPVRGAPAKLGARLATVPATLDGMAFMQKASYRDRDRDVQMAEDYAALRWLQDHVQGSPVILEAETGLYKWGSRVSIYSGLPTVIGWDWHQKQQRVSTAAAVDERIRDVKTIWESSRLDQAWPLLRKYGVSYVYVGGLERIYYPEGGLHKFENAPEQFSVVYRSSGVTIYKVNGLA
jgi:YYY domain-containing protein